MMGQFRNPKSEFRISSSVFGVVSNGITVSQVWSWREICEIYTGPAVYLGKPGRILAKNITKKDYSVFDNMLEGVQVINQDWQYVYLNDAIVRQGKSTREKLLGHSMMESYPGIEHTEVFSNIKTCMLERTPCQMINEFTFNDGTRGWFDLRMEPVDDGVLIMSFDITKQKHLERQLLRFNEALEEKVRARTRELQESLEREKALNDMKSAFVSMASHEFRTPLSSILLSANLITKYAEKGEPDKQDKHIERIRGAVKQLNVILNDFLSLDQLQHGKVEPVLQEFDLNEFLTGVIDELDGLCKVNQKIICDCDQGIRVNLDKHILRHIILNLITNAIKYSEQQILITATTRAESLSIIVEDRGIGIPYESQDKVFDKFFRASNTRDVHGTGLGLHIVYRYVTLLNGSIELESTPGEGTTFRVVLPTGN